MSFLFLINTLLGFLIAQLADLFSRSKDSESSPVKFSFTFFIKDNWEKIVFSLALSMAISVLVHLNIKDLGRMFFQELDIINNLVYAFIGFAPEIILQYAKKKYGFLQPTEVKVTNNNTESGVETFVRK